MMATLTYNEGIVIEIIRRQCRQGDPVATAIVRRCAWPMVSSDATDRALAGVVAKGLAVKASRGFYLPAKDANNGK